LLLRLLLLLLLLLLAMAMAMVLAVVLLKPNLNTRPGRCHRPAAEGATSKSAWTQNGHGPATIYATSPLRRAGRRDVAAAVTVDVAVAAAAVCLLHVASWLSEERK